MLAARERALDQPRRVVEVRRAAARPSASACSTSGSTSKLVAPDRARAAAFLSGSSSRRSARAGRSRSSRSSIRRPSRHARSPYAGPMPRPVVPTFASASRTSLRLVERQVVRHDHVRAAADPHPRRRRSRAREHVELVDQRHRVDHDAVADDRCDVRVEHARRRQAELEHLVAADDRVARRCRRPGSARPSRPARRGSRWSCPCPRRPTGARRSQLPASGACTTRLGACRPRAAPKEKGPDWAGTWIDVSRVVPPIARRIPASGCSDRLTGRSLRLEARCLDPPDRGPAASPKTGRSIAAAHRRKAPARQPRGGGGRTFGTAHRYRYPLLHAGPGR